MNVNEKMITLYVGIWKHVLNYDILITHQLCFSFNNRLYVYNMYIIITVSRAYLYLTLDT